MSAKNQVKHPTKAALAEAAALVELLKSTLSSEEFKDFEERALDPEIVAEAKLREEAERQMDDFIGSIPKIAAGYKLPAGFAEMWEALLAEYERDTRERFITSGSDPRHLDSLIKRGWITADVDALALRSNIKEPPAKLHPIPVVLINNEGHWTAPTMLNQIVKAHPFIRVITEKLPSLTAEEQIAKAIKLAETRRKEGDYHGTNLAQAAERLDLFLHEQLFGEPIEFGWMHTAKESRQFWDILDAAIGFGRSLANHETYGDGSVEKLIQRSLVLGSGKRATGWRLIIQQELQEIYRERGEVLTPAKLRARMGAKPPGSKEEILSFGDQKYAALDPISWKDFQIRAKKAAEKLDL